MLIPLCKPFKIARCGNSITKSKYHVTLLVVDCCNFVMLNQVNKMKRINTNKFFEITASILMILIVSISCVEEEEKKIMNSESDFEIENITNVSSINFKIKSVINQLIEKSNDSLLIELLSEIEKNHTQVDTIVNSVAQKKLIVLSDGLSTKTYYIKYSTKNSLNDFIKFLENEKYKFEKIRHKNEISELSDFYERKIEELEQNITKINDFLETQNKPNY